MKLSAAIRAGAKIRSQARGCYFLTHRESVVASCAQGAAYEGAGLGIAATCKGNAIYNAITAAWPFLEDQASVHFHSKDTKELPWRLTAKLQTSDDCSVRRLIVMLNDGELWTRERIADFLETAGL